MLRSELPCIIVYIPDIITKIHTKVHTARKTVCRSYKTIPDFYDTR